MTSGFDSIAPSEFQSPDQLPPEKKWRLKPIYLIALLAAIFACLVLYFVLSAKAVLFNVNTENANIRISGGISFPIGESRLLLRGNYIVDITAQGFEPISDQLPINSDTPPQLSYEMQPLPGDLQITLLGEEQIIGSAKISGDELAEAQFIEAPNELLFKNLPAGSYQLSVDAYLYKDKDIEIDFPGQDFTHNVEVQLEPNWGWVTLTTEPSSATIYVDGQALQSETPLASDEENRIRARIEAGTPEIQLALDDYKPVVREIGLSTGQTLDLGFISLEHVDSKISVQTQPQGVSVLVNQDYMGETPIVLDLLPDRKHKIELFKAGFKPRTENIEVEKNSQIDLNYKLEPDLVQVSVSLYPQNADLRIAGKPFTVSTNQVSLPAIEHLVEVSAPGFESQTIKFLPIRGTRQHLQVRLLTNEQALWANIPPSYKTVVGQEMKLFREPGAVQMGSSRRETGRRANEANWQATLKRPIYVGLNEVSNQQYKTYDPEHSSGNFEGHSLDGANQPVISISWQQAALYCNWLSEKEGLDPFYTTERGFVSGHNSASTGYRLLTEAEWNWLAKMTASGFPKKYIWGDSEEIPEAVENYADQSVSDLINFTLDSLNDSFVTSAPVGSFPANDKGIYDLSGNVNEWVHDWYAPAPYNPKDTVVDPLGPDEGEFHVIRGASWARGYMPQLRLAYRDYDSTGRNDLGFRVARYAM